MNADEHRTLISKTTQEFSVIQLGGRPLDRLSS